MRKGFSVGHPLSVCASYLLVPLVVDVMVIAISRMTGMPASFFALNAPGALVLVEWGWVGITFCIGLGLLLGLPVAGFQRAYLRARAADLKEGAECAVFCQSWEYAAMMTAPWLMAILAGHLLGSLVVFPPLGGPLIGFNVLLARPLVLRAHTELYVRAIQAAPVDEDAEPALVLQTNGGG